MYSLAKTFKKLWKPTNKISKGRRFINNNYKPELFFSYNIKNAKNLTNEQIKYGIIRSSWYSIESAFLNKSKKLDLIELNSFLQFQYEYSIKNNSNHHSVFLTYLKEILIDSKIKLNKIDNNHQIFISHERIETCLDWITEKRMKKFEKVINLKPKDAASLCWTSYKKCDEFYQAAVLDN